MILASRLLVRETLGDDFIASVKDAGMVSDSIIGSRCVVEGQEKEAGAKRKFVIDNGTVVKIEKKK